MERVSREEFLSASWREQCVKESWREWFVVYRRSLENELVDAVA